MENLAHNSNWFKNYGILKFGQKHLISSLCLPLWITSLYLFLDNYSSTGAKWLKRGIRLFEGAEFKSEGELACF